MKSFGIGLSAASLARLRWLACASWLSLLLLGCGGGGGSGPLPVFSTASGQGTAGHATPGEPAPVQEEELIAPIFAPNTVGQTASCVP